MAAGWGCLFSCWFARGLLVVVVSFFADATNKTKQSINQNHQPKLQNRIMHQDNFQTNQTKPTCCFIALASLEREAGSRCHYLNIKLIHINMNRYTHECKKQVQAMRQESPLAPPTKTKEVHWGGVGQNYYALQVLEGGTIPTRPNNYY